MKVAKAANVKTLVIFHHDPSHDDDFLDRIGQEVTQKFPGAIMAREGMVLQVGKNLHSPESFPVIDTRPPKGVGFLG